MFHADDITEVQYPGGFCVIGNEVSYNIKKV